MYSILVQAAHTCPAFPQEVFDLFGYWLKLAEKYPTLQWSRVPEVVDNYGSAQPVPEKKEMGRSCAALGGFWGSSA
jgi:hypothetical protein